MSKWHWFAKRSFSGVYAVRKVSWGCGWFFVRMHRQITHCPTGSIVHHLNGNTLDNRKENLVVMTKDLHAFYH